MSNTSNDFGISYYNKTLMPLFPVAIKTKQQAYRTAVCIKDLAEVLPDEESPLTFEEVETAIRNA